MAMGDPERLAEILIRLSRALLAVYAVSVIIDSLPIKLLAPEWHFIVATNLVNFVSIPLVAYALVHLAHYLSPAPRIEAVLTQIGKAAQIAALGFLLLIPLLTYSAFENADQVIQNNERQRKFTQRSVAQLNRAIQESSSARELQARMFALQGPRIGDDALQIPLPALKQQVQSAISQAAGTIESQLRNPLSAEYLPLYKQYFRTGLLALASAFGFFSLAWWPSKTQLMLSGSLYGRKLSLNPARFIAAIMTRIEPYKMMMEDRASKAAALASLKKMTATQRKIQLQQEREQRRNENELRKYRERLRRQSEQMDKRK